jgi:hypothetical protein
MISLDSGVVVVGKALLLQICSCVF